MPQRRRWRRRVLTRFLGAGITTLLNHILRLIQPQGPEDLAAR